MNCIEIAKKAIAETQEASRFVSPELRKLLAFGQVAIIISKMNEPSAGLKVLRLEDALLEISTMLQEEGV